MTETTKAHTKGDGYPPWRVLLVKFFDRMMGRKWFTALVIIACGFYAISRGWTDPVIRLLQAIPGLGTLLGGLG